MLRGLIMQRLFSTFPNSWPGLGLLTLRCVLAYSWILSLSPLGLGTSILIGGFLVAGLWTPLAALTTAGVGLWAAFTIHDSLSIIMTGIALSVAMLGPGAWSLDSILFGRKKIGVN